MQSTSTILSSCCISCKGYEARFVNRQMVTVKDLKDEQRDRMTIQASLPLPLALVSYFSL
jgi:hypothetical protein